MLSNMLVMRELKGTTKTRILDKGNKKHFEKSSRRLGNATAILREIVENESASRKETVDSAREKTYKMPM